MNVFKYFIVFFFLIIHSYICKANYLNSWKFRHPYSDNMKLVFERSSTKNLNCFFSDLIGSTKKLEYKITKAQLLDSNFVELEIKNTDYINGPLALNGMKNNN